MNRYTLDDNDLSIFLFHGVVESSNYQIRNYTKKHLLKKEFVQFLQWAKNAGQALSMEDVVAHHTKKMPYPARAFAITFDDGFANNAEIAAPILNNMRIPATFYLTTDFIARNRMSWTDRLEACFEKVAEGRVSMPGASEHRSFRSAQDKIGILNELRRCVKNDPQLDSDQVVAGIYQGCGLMEPSVSDDPLDKKMNWDQVKHLANNPLFTIGGHTHTHKILSFLSPQRLREEIEVSLNEIRSEAGITAHHYSYPEGLSHCYSNSVIDVLKDNGIVCCPTAIDGVNHFTDDLFHLKRISVVL